VLNKQLAIPGLEPSSAKSSFRPGRKPAHSLEERITFLENKVAVLEMEVSLMKIQMERDFA